jgi:hypothetical protein
MTINCIPWKAARLLTLETAAVRLSQKMNAAAVILTLVGDQYLVHEFGVWLFKHSSNIGDNFISILYFDKLLESKFPSQDFPSSGCRCPS